jgi:hypothetical protein
MTSSRRSEESFESTPNDPAYVDPVDPGEWVKPVELIELLQRRAAKRRRIKAPTSSPFYDADFVATHRGRRRRKPGGQDPLTGQSESDDGSGSSSSPS